MASNLNITILCVDDNPDDIFLVRRILQKEGYTVVAASNSDDALRIINSQSISLVLLDLKIRGSQQGVEIAKRIKALHPTLLVAIFSGWHEPPAGSEQYSDMFISKGPDMTETLAKVKSLLRLAS